jgi:hypothetical protein
MLVFLLGLGCARISSPARNLIFRNHIYRHYLSKHSQEITSKLSMTSRAALFLISDYDTNQKL